MNAAELRQTAEFQALLEVSERLGRDPLQVQGPGGNTSLKVNGKMWIKASGTWLAEARTREIMVLVDAAGLRAALIGNAPEAADSEKFVLAEGGDGLRPSIETTLHAAIGWPVVLHTHCVATIATAIRADAPKIVANRLSDLGAAFVPYVKPGVDLARTILEVVPPATRVVVLGNHGLLVAGMTPYSAEQLLREVSSRLNPGMPETADPAPDFVRSLDGSGFIAVPYGPTNQIARDPTLLALADGNTLYPDHLIFLGPGVVVARSGETVSQAYARTARDWPPRKLVLVPGQGSAVPSDASPSVLALARALGDVLLCADTEAPIVRLTTAQEYDLLYWDAEKHRQALEGARSGAGDRCNPGHLGPDVSELAVNDSQPPDSEP